jgi:peptidyl-prolyl cis-trans isomerase B (cyclophilin B)
MARSNEPNSGGSQFFICAASVPHLNGQYTVFGQVVQGEQVIEQIVNLPRDARDNPNRRVTMKVRLEKRDK